MNTAFPRILTLLRKERGVSQKQVSADLQVSQALLSHYEKGIRECGLDFVVRAADYYGVSCDYLLGRTADKTGAVIAVDEIPENDPAARDNQFRGSVLPVLNKKLLVNSVGILFDLLGRTGSKEAIKAASDYLGTAVYRLFRHLYRAGGNNNEDFFAVPVRHFVGGLPNADMICSEVDYVDALAVHVKEKGEFPLLNHDTLSAAYPGAYQSLLQIIHNTGERINHRMNARRADAR